MIRQMILMTTLLALTLVTSSCQSDKQAKTETKADKKEVWIYTSMYKDTIADLTPKLEKDFPGVKFQWFQAGSEEIATKVNAEILAGGTKADILISSDRFWYEEMASMGKLHSYKSEKGSTMNSQLRHPEGFYHTLSIPVMVMAYNNEAVKKEEAPSTFKEMAEGKWSKKFTTGSPLASGTNFTTMAMLQHHYGWDYFKNLKKNETIAQGGNSSVLRRIQSKERPVGWVLLENLLRFKDKDKRIEVVFPKDGAVIHSNIMAITNKTEDRTTSQKVVDWLFSNKGQEAMTRSFMYSPFDTFAPPKGAPELSTILKNSFPWTPEFLKGVTAKRAELKEKYTEIMFE